MKKILSVISLMFLFNAYSVGQDLPKACFGKYGGEMPAYRIVYEGVELNIDEHDVFIAIDGDEVVYTGGDLELIGTYSAFKQGKNEYLIKAALSNGKTIHYELSFIWNKKDEKVYIAPKNGQSEAVLERLD